MIIKSIQTVTGKYVTNIHYQFIKSIHVTCIKLYCASFIPTDFIRLSYTILRISVLIMDCLWLLGTKFYNAGNISQYCRYVCIDEILKS